MKKLIMLALCLGILAIGATALADCYVTHDMIVKESQAVNGKAIGAIDEGSRIDTVGPVQTFNWVELKGEFGSGHIFIYPEDIVCGASLKDLSKYKLVLMDKTVFRTKPKKSLWKKIISAFQ